MSDDKVPFLDLVTPHLQIEEELLAVFRAALKTAAFIGGPMVENFERDFATFCETQHCIGVGSGTDALRFALTAAGVRPGDTVITVSNTFIATTEAISQAGAHPDFVDVDERTFCLDPEKLRSYLERDCTEDSKTGRLINTRTGRPVTAVVPVHLYGQMANMDPILELAGRFKLLVIEDACQAHGAGYFSTKQQRWFKAGAMGDAAAFSFYPGKNLGACGEAGAITTNKEATARICRMLRDHGQSKKYHHDLEGYNGRLDSIQAGLLHVKLRYLPEWTEQRRQCARVYDDLLSVSAGVIEPPFVPAWSRPVYHLYVVRVTDRELMQQELAEAGIGSGIHYPIPLHLSVPYAFLGFQRGDLPVTEKAASEVLSLPMFPTLSPAAQQHVAAQAIKSARAHARVAVGPAASGRVGDN
jgi:dTDP-4-amino-4,6-dideoxygalactose transaminase